MMVPARPYATPFEAIAAEGDADYWRGVPRSACPFGGDGADRTRWLDKWDAAAHEAARILKANAAAQLYRAALDAAALLRDMRTSPRTLTTRTPRYRDTEVALSTALTRAIAASPTPGETQ